MSEPSYKFLPKFHQGFLVFVGLSFVAAGIPHFTHPEFYAPMMPSYLPWHNELILVSGVFEILGGLGMILPRTRQFSSIGLIALLLAVFPANLHVAVNQIPFMNEPINPTLLWGRLPFQLIFIYMVWWAGLKKHPWLNPTE
jgi:uncharacterized membrane protein